MKTSIFKSLIVLALLCFCLNYQVLSQNIGINGTGANPNASALLDIDDAGSNNKGLLIPRISLTAINIAAPVTSPAASLLIYNIATAGSGATAVSPGYYYWDGIQWGRFAYNPSGVSTTAWNISGNAGTTAATNFIGTTDAQDFVVKSNNTEKMRITSTGSIGIGISTPSANVHVYVGSGFAGTVLPLRSGLTVDVNPQSSNGYSIFKGTGGTLFSSGTVYGLNLDLNPTGTTIGTNYGVYVNNETQNYFSNKVGVGTPTPSFKLHVVDGNIAQTITTNNSHSIVMQNPSGRNWQLYHLSPTDGNAPNGFMFEHFDGTFWQRRLTINQAGLVGVGAPNPIAQFDLGGSGQMWVRQGVGGGLPASAGTGLKIESNTNGGLLQSYDYATSTPKNIILNTVGGNVGINTTTPATKLSIVSGTIGSGFQLQDGSEGIGKTLISDATGKASWSDPTDNTYDLYSSFVGPVGTTTSIVGSNITLPKGVYYVQSYNLLQGITYSASYYARIDVATISGAIINGGINRDLSTLGTSSDQYYDMPGFIIKVTSPTATVAIRIYHANGGTISLSTSNMALNALFSKIN